jgi:hypothetical protein
MLAATQNAWNNGKNCVRLAWLMLAPPFAN